MIEIINTIIATVVGFLLALFGYNRFVHKPAEEEQTKQIERKTTEIIADAIEELEEQNTAWHALNKLRIEQEPLPTPEEAFYMLQTIGVQWAVEVRECKGKYFKYYNPKPEGREVFEGDYYSIIYDVIHEKQGNTIIPTIDIKQILRTEF